MRSSSFCSSSSSSFRPRKYFLIFLFGNILYNVSNSSTNFCTSLVLVLMLHVSFSCNSRRIMSLIPSLPSLPNHLIFMVSPSSASSSSFNSSRLTFSRVFQNFLSHVSVKYFSPSCANAAHQMEVNIAMLLSSSSSSSSSPSSSSLFHVPSSCHGSSLMPYTAAKNRCVFSRNACFSGPSSNFFS